MKLFQKFLHIVSHQWSFPKSVIQRAVSFLESANICCPDSESPKLIFEGVQLNLAGESEGSCWKRLSNLSEASETRSCPIMCR
jgi:hypothetical protein